LFVGVVAGHDVDLLSTPPKNAVDLISTAPLPVYKKFNVKYANYYE